MPPMMAGFQAEENLTGEPPKMCEKNSGRYLQNLLQFISFTNFYSKFTYCLHRVIKNDNKMELLSLNIRVQCRIL